MDQIRRDIRRIARWQTDADRLRKGDFSTSDLIQGTSLYRKAGHLRGNGGRGI